MVGDQSDPFASQSFKVGFRKNVSPCFGLGHDRLIVFKLQGFRIQGGSSDGADCTRNAIHRSFAVRVKPIAQENDE